MRRFSVSYSSLCPLCLCPVLSYVFPACVFLPYFFLAQVFLACVLLQLVLFQLVYSISRLCLCAFAFRNMFFKVCVSAIWLSRQFHLVSQLLQNRVLTLSASQFSCKFLIVNTLQYSTEFLRYQLQLVFTTVSHCQLACIQQGFYVISQLVKKIFFIISYLVLKKLSRLRLASFRENFSVSTTRFQVSFDAIQVSFFASTTHSLLARDFCITNSTQQPWYSSSSPVYLG